MPADLALEAKVAYELYDIAKKQGWIDQLLDVFKKRHRVLVLGTSGTGKTQFVRSLTDAMPATIDRIRRSGSAEHDKVKISDKPFEFITVPGERTKSVPRMEAIRGAMKDLSGIVNVTAFGYHEGSAAETKVFDTAGNIKSKFLTDGRNEEITALGEWTAFLGDRSITRWLMTIVTKADLWWDERANVSEHYSSGEYFRALGPAQSLGHNVLEYCSEVHKFYGKGPVSSAFDDADRVKLRVRVLSELVLAVKS